MTAPMRSREFRFAENLKKALSVRRITLTTAAKKSGMNKSTLHGYYNGVVPRNLLKIRDLADLLEIPFAELLFGNDPQESADSESFEGRYEVTVRKINKNSKDGKR